MRKIRALLYTVLFKVFNWEVSWKTSYEFAKCRYGVKSK